MERRGNWDISKKKLEQMEGEERLGKEESYRKCEKIKKK